MPRTFRHRSADIAGMKQLVLVREIPDSHIHRDPDAAAGHHGF
jgi:hypothetical protein